MNKLQTLAGPSCLTAAADDEPLFVLRANDELAPTIVREWSHAYQRSKGGPALMTAAQLQKLREAQRCAFDMESWWAKDREK